jgi:hypothetical protein
MTSVDKPISVLSVTNPIVVQPDPETEETTTVEQRPVVMNVQRSENGRTWKVNILAPINQRDYTLISRAFKAEHRKYARQVSIEYRIKRQAEISKEGTN